MPIVTVKNKYQVVIPVRLRNEVGINVGDILDAKVERGRIVFTPKFLIDRGVAESLEDYKNGRSYGSFDSAEKMLTSLHRNVKKLRAAKAASPRR
jgi:bifunctional DNA-binding transcriptional regulator/antitoxin component of YhaV-PrlF toxin-antitoxin module